MLKFEEQRDPESCWNKALPHERVFVLLARDEAAPAAVRAWADERVRLGKNRAVDPQILEADECQQLMRREREGIRADLAMGNERPNPAENVRLTLFCWDCRANHEFTGADVERILYAFQGMYADANEYTKQIVQGVRRKEEFPILEQPEDYLGCLKHVLAGSYDCEEYSEHTESLLEARSRHQERSGEEGQPQRLEPDAGPDAEGG